MSVERPIGFSGIRTEVDRLSPAELQALATADIEGAVSNARLQQLLTDHPVDITRMLTGLCDRGFLVSDNRRRWTTYELSRRGAEGSLVDGDDEQLSKNLGQLPGEATQLSDVFGESPGDLSCSPGDLSHSPGDLSHSAGDLSHSAPGFDELRRVAEPVALASRAPVTVVRATILQLCTGRFLTASLFARPPTPSGIRDSRCSNRGGPYRPIRFWPPLPT